MKPNRNASALGDSLLASKLRIAAEQPLLPPQPQLVDPSQTATAPVVEAKPTIKPAAKSKAKVGKPKAAIETEQKTLRLPRPLLDRYITAAARRSKKEGRMVSAQEIMVEVLETGPRVQ